MTFALRTKLIKRLIVNAHKAAPVAQADQTTMVAVPLRRLAAAYRINRRGGAIPNSSGVYHSDRKDRTIAVREGGDIPYSALADVSPPESMRLRKTSQPRTGQPKY